MFIASKHLPNAHDFRKDPAWRWLRCGYLLDHDRQPLRRDDTATREAWLFRQALGQCRGAEDREWLARDFPALIEAHRLFTSAVPLRRAELEARLLAGETDDVIAVKCSMAPPGVTSYHDLYFDVRSKLQANSYIATVVLAGKPYKGIAPDDHEAILKSLGYALGGEMVDEVLDCLRDPPVVPASLDGLDLDALRRLRDRLGTKILILLETTPASAAHPATWIGLQQRFTEARRVARERGDDGAAVLGSIRAVLDLVDAVGRGDIGQKVDPPHPAGAADVRGVVEAVPA
jgi:hypothetical protein